MELTVTLTGTAPMLMHSERGVDPLDPDTKAKNRAATQYKTDKTDESFLTLARLEHRLGMYYDPKLGPYVPGNNVQQCFVSGAKAFRLGSTLNGSALVIDDMIPVIYSGPRTDVELWEDKRFVHAASVKIGQSRVMRYRPVFPEWQLVARVLLDTATMEVEDFEKSVHSAGGKGLGDWRPRFGRFTATVERA